MGTCERAHTMSQLSKVKHSRNQWKAKAKQRSDHNRYLRKQLARLKAERAQARQEFKEIQTRLRQLESQVQAVAVRPKVDVVGLALNLFLEARIGFRAVCRVLALLASDLGIKRAPCPQTVINSIISSLRWADRRPISKTVAVICTKPPTCWRHEAWAAPVSTISPTLPRACSSTITNITRPLSGFCRPAGASRANSSKPSWRVWHHPPCAPKPAL